jgi:hypothetical protein
VTRGGTTRGVGTTTDGSAGATTAACSGGGVVATGKAIAVGAAVGQGADSVVVVARNGLEAVASFPVDTHLGVTTSTAKPSTAAETPANAARTRCRCTTLVMLKVDGALGLARGTTARSSTIGIDERDGAGTERSVMASPLSANGVSAATRSSTDW